MEDVHRAIERVARESYGHLIAYLSARTRDVAGAEDALSEALLAALRLWPSEGVPQKPEAWLLTTARRRLIDRARHERMRTANTLTLQLITEETQEITASEQFPDERLKLLFVCAHPAIDPDVHTPLMLQTVLGLDAARIARAFLVSPTTMGQRLVRAKAKIRDTGITFAVPGECELPHRLDAVLEAIYAAYGSGWEDAAGADPRRRGLADEAIWLARALAQRLPDQPEARGLLALILYCEARRPARRAADGQYVPLSEQDVQVWSIPMIDEAERELSIAAKHADPGRFQLEAAIQSAHVERARTGHTDWGAITLFYESLMQISPTLGAWIGHAAAVAEVKGPEAGLELLDKIELNTVNTYQPYWAVRAHFLRQLGRIHAASDAFERAIGLSEDDAVRQFLLKRRE
ncbi:MAG: RNA polymerase subunit sigma-70 [Gammaproteobacteria bacterium]|nr:RNA polymerase subunit sigma-70 [Gammaproteobacteria bacterium]